MFEKNYLQHFYVIPTLRRTGLGSEMHDRFISELRNSRENEAFLKVSRSNKVAINFYTKLGWIYEGADLTDERLDNYCLTLH